MSVIDHPQAPKVGKGPTKATAKVTFSTDPAIDDSAPATDRPDGRIGAALAALRISTGFIFLWAFLDKTFGLGFATPSEGAWIDGGSPTEGFLGHVSVGPLESTFHSWAGDPWANWLFMLGLAGIGVAVIAGVGLRIAAVSGTVMMLLMWAAEWPLAKHTSTGELSGSNNPLVDYHIIYALVFILLAITAAGNTWGLGKAWASLDIVKKNPWLL